MKDLIGERFHNLVVISYAGEKNGNPYWLCKCDCGSDPKAIREYHLTSGATHSCGCKKRKQIIEMNKENAKHGKRYTRIYRIWRSMKYRCYNSDYSNYENYGGRGIIVCDEWKDNFQAFYNWAIQNGYNDKLTIDRINVNGNYEPMNCRWETMKVQENNKRNNRVLLYNGKEQTITQWADEIGIKRETLISRLNAGWNIERALTEPVHSKVS